MDDGREIQVIQYEHIEELQDRVKKLEAILEEICDILEAEPESHLTQYLFKLANISEGGGDS